MSDRMHDHTTIGYRRGCVACAQVEADLALSRAWRLRQALADPAHDDRADPADRAGVVRCGAWVSPDGSSLDSI